MINNLFLAIFQCFTCCPVHDFFGYKQLPSVVGLKPLKMGGYMKRLLKKTMSW